MTVGTYTALGWSWRAMDGSLVAHLVPRRPGPLSRSACGRYAADDARGEALVVSGRERCLRCETKNGTAGPERDGRVAGFGQ
jgi:hypothetical protein